MPTPQSVRDTVQTSGLVATLLAPFIHFTVTQLEVWMSMPLGPGYEAQLLVGTVAVLQWAAAHYRATQVDADPPV